MSDTYEITVRRLGQDEPVLHVRAEEVVVESELVRCDRPGDQWEEWRPTGNLTVKLRRATQ